MKYLVYIDSRIPFLFVLVLISFQFCIQVTNGYCWQSGWNPGFKSEPKVYQLSLTKVRVSWEGIVKRRDCADSFLVKYWRANSPSNYELTDPVDNTVNHIDINVSPKIIYLYQAIAREDKGAILGIDYNKAKAVKFRTSSYNTEVSIDTKDPDGSIIEKPNNTPSNNNIDDGDGLQTKMLGLTIEMLVILSVIGVILVLVIIGIMYRLCCRRKASQYDEDEDEDEMEDSADEDEERIPSEVEEMNRNPNSRHINRNYSNRGNGLNHQPDFNDV